MARRSKKKGSTEPRKFGHRAWYFIRLCDLPLGPDDVCFVCGRQLELNDRVFTYLPTPDIAHMRCVQDLEEKEAARLTDPWNIERAAKANGLTLFQFHDHPSWERARMINEILRGE